MYVLGSSKMLLKALLKVTGSSTLHAINFSAQDLQTCRKQNHSLCKSTIHGIKKILLQAGNW